ncbi:BlaI/MecI/CopY family transcriptional regulator [Novipirellula rosea]|uniref:BlaI/MecI/CopY family transcriptional regulator n=1 Tax=Novipirellula rosea TaxID=1031540 RepID=A0ABP8NPX5_9BACT
MSQSPSKGRAPTLGRVELEILQFIDANHPVTVREVATYWFEKTGQARTTVLTVMDRLKQKGFLTRKKISNVYHYSPKRSGSSVLQHLVSDFVQGVLGGSVAPFVAYLNDAKSIPPDELAQLKQIVNELEASAKTNAKEPS